MGADGHIAIYDWTKTVKQFPELEENRDLRYLVIGDAYIYSNPFGKGKLLVAYWGDNLYEPTLEEAAAQALLWILEGEKVSR